MMLVFLLSMLAWAAPMVTPVQRAETLWLEGTYTESIVVLQAHLEQKPEDVEALWRLARSYYSLGEVYAQDDKDDERMDLYRKVIDVSKRIQIIDPDHGQGPFWHGVALGRISTTKGALSQAAKASKIESLWLKSLTSTYTYEAAELKSGFPSSVYYALGQFYRIVPDSWWVKLLTGVRGDIDKSIAYLNKALAFNPNWLEARKEMGVSLLCKARRDRDPAAYTEAEEHLAKAASISPTTPTEVIDVQHVPIIQERWKDSCGYSRDGWQDFSEPPTATRKP